MKTAQPTNGAHYVKSVPQSRCLSPLWHFKVANEKLLWQTVVRGLYVSICRIVQQVVAKLNKYKIKLHKVYNCDGELTTFPFLVREWLLLHVWLTLTVVPNHP